jgi:hypothetical protein
MITSTFFVSRLTVAWGLLYLLVSITLANTVFDHVEDRIGGIIAFLAVVLASVVVTGAFSHLRRVRLVAGEVNASTLSNRQRRQIEIPFEAGESFDLVEAAIRELPGARTLKARATACRCAPRSPRRPVQRRHRPVGTAASSGAGSATRS